MKALILAAGRGTRIRSVHGERPKCLISCDGETILDHQIGSDDDLDAHCPGQKGVLEISGVVDPWG